MDIGSGKGWPGSSLSNFAGHRFVFDGIECHSMEGFLQSLKFDKPHIQVEVCKLVGKAAKMRGKPRNQHWQRKQTLWWKGCPMYRRSDEYHMLLWRAYCALFEQCESFRVALSATVGATLTHSIGCNDQSLTVLTEREFVAILTKLRKNSLDRGGKL